MDRTLSRSPLLRRGFTMIEILMVVAVLAIMYMIAIPKIGEIRSRSSLRAARQELASAFAAARAAALQKGKTSTLTLASNAATVTVLSGLAGTSVQVYGPVRLDKDLNSTLTALSSAPTTIQFDARGLITPVPVGVTAYKYRLSTSTYSDTLCISPAGIIMPRGCAL